MKKCILCGLIFGAACGAACADEASVSGAEAVVWTKPAADDPLVALVPAEVRARIVVGRIPGEGELPGFRGGAQVASGCPYVLFTDARRLPLARYPNAGDLLVPETAVDTGDVGGRLAKMPASVAFRSDVGAARLARWQREPALWAWGCWKFGWADASLRIESVDPSAGTLTVKGAEIPYGITKGNDTGGRYFVRNAFSEIDEPGEWAVDPATRRVFLLPPEEGLARVALACRENLLVLEGVSDRVIEGRLFENCRGDAVILRNCTNVVVRRSVVRNAGGWGVRILGGRGCRVEGCDFYNLGEGGVEATGGAWRTLTPANHTVDNCYIHDYGQWIMNGRPGVYLKGTGSRATHNLIHDSPDQGILFTGNDHYIGWNVIHDVCQDNFDCGAIYTHTKRDWWQRGHVVEGNVVHAIGGRRPLESVMGIYIDGWSSGVTVRDNIVSRCGYGLFQNSGNDNTYAGNVVVGCQTAIRRNNLGLVGGKSPNWLIRDGRKSWLFQGLDRNLDLFSSPLWKARYPNMLRVYDFENPHYAHNPLFTVATNNCWSWSGPAFFEDHEFMTAYSDIRDNDPVEDVGFVDYEGFNWELRDDSPVRKRLGHGLRFAERGLYASPARVSPPVRFGPHPTPALRSHPLAPSLMRVAVEFHGDLPAGVTDYATGCANCRAMRYWWPKGNVLWAQDTQMRRAADWTDYSFAFVPTVDADVTLRIIGWRGEKTAYDAFAADGCELKNGDFEEEGAWRNVRVQPPDADDGFAEGPYGAVGPWAGVVPASGRRMCLANALLSVEQTVRVRKGVPVRIRFKARPCLTWPEAEDGKRDGRPGPLTVATPDDPSGGRRGKGWWMKRHRAKLAEIKASDGSFDLVMLGDSITHQWEDVGAASLAKLRAEYRVLNLGFGGEGTPQMLWRLQHGEADGYTAKCFMLMIGTNSRNFTDAEIAEGTEAVVRLLLARHPESKILLLPIFPTDPSPFSPVRSKLRRADARVLLSCVDDRRVFWCDFGAKFLDPDGTLPARLMPDYVHPSAEGYEIWRAAILPHLKKLCR